MVVRGRDDEKNHVQGKGKEKAHEKENLGPGIRSSPEEEVTTALSLIGLTIH